MTGGGDRETTVAGDEDARPDRAGDADGPEAHGDATREVDGAPESGTADVTLRAAWAATALGGLAYCCMGFAWFSLPAYLPVVIGELGLTGAQAGLLAGAVPLTYVPMALLTGLAVDRVGPWRGMTVGLVLIGGAHALRGLAGGFPAMLGLTVLLGVGATWITFGLPKLVAAVTGPERRGTLSTVYLLGSYLGTAGALGLARPTLGPVLGGWRPLFVDTGLVIVGFAAAWWLAGRASGVAAAVDRDGGGAGSPVSLSSLPDDLRAVFGDRTLRLLVVVGVVYLLSVHTIQGWAVTVFESRGLAAGVAAAVTTGFVAAQVAGTLTVPPLSDRLGRRRAAVVACGGLVLLGGVGLLGAGANVLASAAAVALVGAGVGGLSPLVRAIPAELDAVGPRLTATAVALVFTVGEAGGFAGPFLVGALRDVTGSYLPGLALVSVGGLFVVLAGALMTELDG